MVSPKCELADEWIPGIFYKGLRDPGFNPRTYMSIRQYLLWSAAVPFNVSHCTICKYLLGASMGECSARTSPGCPVSLTLYSSHLQILPTPFWGILDSIRHKKWVYHQQIIIKGTLKDISLEERKFSLREDLRCKKKCKPRIGKHANKCKWIVTVWSYNNST